MAGGSKGSAAQEQSRNRHPSKEEISPSGRTWLPLFTLLKWLADTNQGVEGQGDQEKFDEWRNSLWVAMMEGEGWGEPHPSGLVEKVRLLTRLGESDGQVNAVELLSDEDIDADAG